MLSSDRRLELKEKASMAQNAWQAFVYANGLNLVVCLVIEWFAANNLVLNLDKTNIIKFITKNLSHIGYR